MQHAISVVEFEALRKEGADFILLDVRQKEEFDYVNIGGLLIPDTELVRRINELDPDKHYIVMCHHGVRSAHATQLLKENDFEKVQNLSGGIDKYAAEINPDLKRY